MNMLQCYLDEFGFSFNHRTATNRGLPCLVPSEAGSIEHDNRRIIPSFLTALLVSSSNAMTPNFGYTDRLNTVVTQRPISVIFGKTLL